MKRALITGVAGLIGSATAKRLLSEGYHVTGIDNNSRRMYFGEEGSVIDNKIEDKNFISYTYDIREKLTTKMVGQDFDVVVHCAAQPSHELANENPMLDFETNVVATVRLLELVRLHSPKATFIYLSTTKVYSDRVNQIQQLIDEQTDTEGFHGIFGANKLAADIIVQEYGMYYDMNTVVFRPGCITGRSHKGTKQHGFLSYLVKCIKNRAVYTIEGDGNQVRDQLHVEDLVDAFMEVIKNPHRDVYIIGGGVENSVSVNEAIELIEKKTGITAKTNHGAGRQADHKYNVHNNKKFKSHYPNWKIKYNLDDIIRDLI